MSRFYVTTPIYYVNDVPHLGTSYTTIATDAVRRYHLLRGQATRMLTGTDEHGLKLEREAQERGMTPIAFVDRMSAHFREAWPKLEIEVSDFIRTTEPRHERGAQEIWERIKRNNPDDIYLGSYEDWYCVGCEEFKTEKDLVQPGNLCAIHRRPVERLKEDTYFFRLSRYTEPLLRLYQERPGFIAPESRRNEVVSFVSTGLRDLSISRTKLTWGIPVPGDPKHVMYVWFDALTNYWTALQGSDDSKAFWSGDSPIVHLIGKDILRFHAVYWPAFLMSAGIPLPTTIFAHGFLTFGGEKMSKSLRNAVEPLGIARAFAKVVGSEPGGADVLRYHLLRAIAFGQDGDFDLSAMIERYNADLGKNLGNLLARTLGLCAKMTAGRVPPKGEWTPLERELHAAALEHGRDALEAWDRIEPHRALERTWAIASAANQYVDRAAPWAEEKKGNHARVETILSTLLAVLGALSVAVWPVLPAKSDEMRRQLGLEPVRPAEGKDWLAVGALPLAAGAMLAPGSPLFPTIDEARARALLAELTPRLEAAAAPILPLGAPDLHSMGDPPAGAGEASGGGSAPASSAAQASTQSDASASTLTYDEFGAVDLRVGVVQSCQHVPKKDKLLKLAVDVGEAEPRTIVAGLALSFQPADLVGRRVIVVANLAPRDFGKGLVSHGMLLATGPSDKLTLATIEGEVAPGAKLK
jgi:methionyl-tRNA synthetase